VEAHVEAALRLGRPGTVGAELEQFVVDRRAPGARPPLERVERALAGLDLPGRSAISTEPGGQVELSSVPCRGPAAAVDALSRDLAAVRDRLAGEDVLLVGLGADPERPPVRQLDTPRYQVSLDAGVAGDGVQSALQRWQRAHAVGPALVATFACSPLLAGRPTGWSSSRQEVWSRVDPSRTCAPDPALGPVQALTRLALTARLMTVRDAEGVCRPAPPGLTFGDWVTGCGPTAPTVADLDYHLTTLFPPVRARGWFELRYLDALPADLWQVAVAVAAVLLDDDVAADQARAACAPVEGRWLRAARVAVSDRALGQAAVACLGAAEQALTRAAAPALAAAVAAYVERFTARGRCPADEVLEAHRAGRPLLAAREVAA